MIYYMVKYPSNINFKQYSDISSESDHDDDTKQQKAFRKYSSEKFKEIPKHVRKMIESNEITFEEYCKKHSLARKNKNNKE